MKVFLVLIFFVINVNLFADDILLKNGNAIRNVKIIDSTSSTYTILTSFNKKDIERSLIANIVYKYFNVGERTIFHDTNNNVEYVDRLTDESSFFSMNFEKPANIDLIVNEKQNKVEDNNKLEEINQSIKGISTAIYVVWALSIGIGVLVYLLAK